MTNIMALMGSNQIYQRDSVISFNMYLKQQQWIANCSFDLQVNQTSTQKRNEAKKYTTLFLGHKWTNMTVEEMVKIFASCYEFH